MSFYSKPPPLHFNCRWEPKGLARTRCISIVVEGATFENEGIEFPFRAHLYRVLGLKMEECEVISITYYADGGTFEIVVCHPNMAQVENIRMPPRYSLDSARRVFPYLFRLNNKDRSEVKEPLRAIDIDVGKDGVFSS